MFISQIFVLVNLLNQIKSMCLAKITCSTTNKWAQWANGKVTKLLIEWSRFQAPARVIVLCSGKDTSLSDINGFQQIYFWQYFCNGLIFHPGGQGKKIYA